MDSHGRYSRGVWSGRDGAVSLEEHLTAEFAEEEWPTTNEKNSSANFAIAAVKDLLLPGYSHSVFQRAEFPAGLVHLAIFHYELHILQDLDIA